MATAKTTTPIDWRKIAAQALVAGTAGGILYNAWLWIVAFGPKGASLLDMWSSFAAIAAGKWILTSPNAPWLGLAVTAATSIAWAGAYAYVATYQPNVRRRWALAGIVYGLVVYLLMQTVLLVGGNFVFPPTPNDFMIALFAHTVFFGLPVAFVVHMMDRG